MRVVEHRYLPVGKVALRRDGVVIWVGSLGAPWDDVECDEVLVSPTDYERIHGRIGLRNIVRALREHDTDCRSHAGKQCDCGAEGFNDHKWDVP